MAGAITKVRAGFATTSIVNTNEKSVEIDATVLRVAEFVPGTLTEPSADGRKERGFLRASEVLKRLRLGHLNEERKDIEKPV